MPLDPALTPIVDRLAVAAGDARVLTVAGAVAVGKSTVAAALAGELRALGRRVEVVSTDGFLYPNAGSGGAGPAGPQGVPRDL